MRVWTKSNTVTLLRGGKEYFNTILSAIDSAQREIFLVSYIFKSDKIGEKVSQKLKEAAKRGVSVHVMLDGVGSKSLTPDFMKDLKKSGVKLIVFRPLHRALSLGRIFFRRLHQKIILIDTTQAFVGGVNIDDAQFKQLDYAVEVRGPLVFRIYKFVKLFKLRVSLEWVGYFKLRRLKLRAISEVHGTVRAAFVIRDNLQHRKRIEKLYLQAIDRAKESILIANAYFSPGFRFRHALVRAAERGVRVRLLLAGRTDHPIVKNAAALMYRGFLRSGIEIYEYHQEMLHAKVAVIDGHWATVGSCNLDIFSLFLSLEANVVVDDKPFAKNLEADLAREIKNGAIRVDASFIEAKSPWDWAVCWLSYWALKLLRVISQA